MNDKVYKMGVFGASFNPLHLGHLSLLTQVQEHFAFDLIKVVPAGRVPLAPPIQEVSPNKRLTLVRKVFKEYSFLEVDDQEIKRGGINYSVDTIETLLKESPEFKEIFLIMGMDQWINFAKWKNFKILLKKVHLVICSRKGYEWDSSIPLFLKEYVCSPWKFSASSVIKLTTGKNIYCLPLKDQNISSSQIRRYVAQNLSIGHLVPPMVEQWIKKEALYQIPPLKKNTEEASQIMQFCVDVLLDKKARRVKTFDLSEFSWLPFDFTLVASGLNTRHTKAMASYLQKEVKKRFSVSAQQMEGQERGEWIVLDYGGLAVHIFYDYTREYYRLEDLWKKAPTKDFAL